MKVPNGLKVHHEAYTRHSETSIFHWISDKDSKNTMRADVLAATAKLPAAINNESVRLRFISKTVPSQRDEQDFWKERWLSFLVLSVSLFSSIAYVMKKNGRGKAVCWRQKSLIIVKYYFPAVCTPTG